MSDLATYLTNNGIKQADFAKRLEVDQATVSRLTRRQMRPSLALAVAVERETNGAIKATSWIDVKPDPGSAE